MHASHKVLFDAVRLGPVTTRNRFYQVPYGPGAGNLLQVDAGIKEVRAEGGWGVVCSETCSIHPSADAGYFGIHRLWNDRHIGESAGIANAIHRHGALAGIELGHFGLGANNIATRTPILGPTRQPALGATAIFPHQAQAIDRQTIKALLGWQRAAAIRAQKAGFDIVYVYAAHSDLTLPMQFLSPRYNRRTDEYGGSLENRARLIRQMIEVTKDAVGDRCAIAVRLSVDELLGLDGITADREGRQIIELLGELPDLWDVNVSTWVNDTRSSRFAKEGWQEEYVSFVKKCTTKPVVGVGRFTSPDTMASQIRRGVLDLIGAARPSIADPFLPRKIEEGRVDDIRECIGCNHCVKTGLHAVSGCTQNPTMGEEWRLGWHPERIQPKPEASQGTVLVVGAGPAGLEVARALAQRGYRVSLAEATDELGGRVRLESTLPGLQEWIRVANWRVSQISRSPLVTVFKKNELSVEDVLGLEHEHVVIATGSKWRCDGIGVTHRTAVDIDSAAQVFTPDDLMDGRFPERGPVVLFDDDHYYIGAVLAEQLRRRNFDVRLITPGHTVSQLTGYSLDAGNVLARMRELEIPLSVNTNLVQVGQHELTVECLLSGQTSKIAAAALVLVTSREPVDLLYQELVAVPERLTERGIHSVAVLGDAHVPDTIAAAVFGGHRYAREFEGQPIDIAMLPPSARALY